MTFYTHSITSNLCNLNSESLALLETMSFDCRCPDLSIMLIVKPKTEFNFLWQLLKLLCTLLSTVLWKLSSTVCVTVCYTTSVVYVWVASTNSVNFSVSGGHWTLIRWLDSSMLSWIHALITATLFVLVHQRQQWTSYSVCSTLLRMSIPALGLGQILRDELHWLDIPDQTFFKLTVTLSERPRISILVRACISVYGADNRQHLTCVPQTVIYLQYYGSNSALTSGFFSRWSDGRELSPGFYPGPDNQCRLFQTFT